MANGIAVNDNRLGVSPPLIATRQPYYPAPVGYYQLYNPASVVWEAESLSTWSEWSDHDGPCCGCDCDCQPAVNDRNSGDRCCCSTQNRTSTLPLAQSVPKLQNYRVVPEPVPSMNVRNNSNIQQNVGRSPYTTAFGYDIHEYSSMEDLIYRTAKQQRHLDDAQRRIQDWIKIMPGLVGGETVPTSEQEPGKCDCKSCKDGRKRDARKARKEKKHMHEPEKKKSSKRRR
ncbi:uncharacterized protein B0J16DRAFT_372341 [Fusarium flagelliforme]|uniref:Uncharacterized protein n=1 Tax=Fusarium flagelliforme TaxID=2675880 RepID=A0A395MT42_9HYPO|nr:uncharacterized protein B0J16DRAFT_372341 [Fusarium flagelliforme]KAH7185551.1 hypothetical protein B0J16DRAFT_372341 [Fusarium flagelliforme]RFN51086.1 hypothetical protein FIE12Z_4649 [Fusarium flagelliforme]